MAEYPSIGISEEELVKELSSEMDEVLKIHDLIKLYRDLPDDIEEISNKKLNVSKKTTEILRGNLEGCHEKISLLIDSYTKIIFMTDLLKKYFPESKILKIQKIEETVDNYRNFKKSLERNLINKASSGLPQLIEMTSIFREEKESNRY